MNVTSEDVETAVAQLVTKSLHPELEAEVNETLELLDSNSAFEEFAAAADRVGVPRPLLIEGGVVAGILIERVRAARVAHEAESEKDCQKAA